MLFVIFRMSAFGFLTFRLYFILHRPSSVSGVFYFLFVLPAFVPLALRFHFAWAPAYGSLVSEFIRSLENRFVFRLFLLYDLLIFRSEVSAHRVSDT